MTGIRQLERFVREHRDPSTLPEGRFEWDGAKVRCVLCHRRGYGFPLVRDSVTFSGQRVRWSQRVSPWQISCLRDHPWPCSCGRSFTEFVDLWKHIGADRPVGWGREGHHAPALSCEVAS